MVAIIYYNYFKIYFNYIIMYMLSKRNSEDPINERFYLFIFTYVMN